MKKPRCIKCPQGRRQRSTTAPAATGEIKRSVASRDCPVCKERERRRSGPVCNEHANRTSSECRLLHQIDRLKARIKELEAAVDRCNASS